MTRRSQLAAVLLAGLSLVGCQDPYTQGTPTAGDSPRPHERPQAEPLRGDALAPPAPAAAGAPAFREPAARRNARTVLEAFCWQWANWSWHSIERQQQRLARLATGPLATELAAAARHAKLDRALWRDRLAMRGRLVAVNLDPPGSPRRAVCVTAEREIQSGRAELAGRHRVYRAALERTAQGWGVSRWEPQP